MEAYSRVQVIVLVWLRASKDEAVLVILQDGWQRGAFARSIAAIDLALCMKQAGKCVHDVYAKLTKDEI